MVSLFDRIYLLPQNQIYWCINDERPKLDISESYFSLQFLVFAGCVASWHRISYHLWQPLASLDTREWSEMLIRIDSLNKVMLLSHPIVKDNKTSETSNWSVALLESLPPNPTNQTFIFNKLENLELLGQVFLNPSRGNHSFQIPKKVILFKFFCFQVFHCKWLDSRTALIPRS